MDGMTPKADKRRGKLRLRETLHDRPLIGYSSGANSPRWKDVLRADPCSYCGVRSAYMTVDHVEAFSKSQAPNRRSNLAGNAVGACVRCNAAKDDVDLLQYLFEHPVGRPLEIEVEWASRRMSSGLFKGLCATPPRKWWCDLFTMLFEHKPTRRLAPDQPKHAGIWRFGVWHAVLEVGGEERTLEVQAKVAIGDRVESVYVRRLEWVG